jgi:hypothetical protein
MMAVDMKGRIRLIDIDSPAMLEVDDAKKDPGCEQDQQECQDAHENQERRDHLFEEQGMLGRMRQVEAAAGAGYVGPG